VTLDAVTVDAVTLGAVTLNTLLTRARVMPLFTPDDLSVARARLTVLQEAGLGAVERFWQVNGRRAEDGQWQPEVQAATSNAFHHARWARFWFNLRMWAGTVVRVCC